MVNVKVNGIEVSVEENSTILEACKKAGVLIPTLCYLKDVNEISACRVCVVEVEGENKLVASCSAKVSEGMSIITNSDRVLKARKVNLELILSRHNDDCNSCKRNQNCTLQKLAKDIGYKETVYEKHIPEKKGAEGFALERDASKCINCYRCVTFCDKVQNLGIWDIVGVGSRAKIDTASGKNIKNDDCTLCGQCITHCPTGALTERNDTKKVLDAIADKDTITVVQVAPAVRTAWGEPFGVDGLEASMGKMVTALKMLGFNYVYDTVYSADLTIMEEATEFIGRLTKGGKMPMFTSCCPAWVRYVKDKHPDLKENLSTAKSPQQMFGAVTKTYFAEKIGVDPKKIFCVSIMPCVSKKRESEEHVANYGRDVDAVLTTRELANLLKGLVASIKDLKETPFDSILADGTGAGVIFGTTGGVMEAALRTAYYFVTGKNPDADAFKMVRIDGGIGEFTFDVNNATLNIAVASGLKNAEIVINQIKNGKKLDFVEIMACPGGCAGGGGQIIKDGEELATIRGKTLYEDDKRYQKRFSHENEDVKKLYEEFLEKPNSKKAHEILHTHH